MAQAQEVELVSVFSSLGWTTIVTELQDRLLDLLNSLQCGRESIFLFP